MDGIPSSLTSVTPILHETTLVSEKGGITGPQVEIMPLPDNSFNSGSATAELLNNPFTLSIDIRGYEKGGGGVGRAGQPAAGMTSEEAAAGTALGDAYTLSLGNGEETAAVSEMARELTRMKNYEMLGKSARQTYRLNPQTRSAEPEVHTASDETEALLRGRMGNLLSRTDAGLDDVDMRTTVAGTAVFGESAQEPLLSRPDNASGNPASALNRQQPQQALISGALAFQLTPSDYEAILSLEPDLQEALLNMLGSPSGDTVSGLAGRSNLPVSGMIVQTGRDTGQSPAGQGAVFIGAPGQTGVGLPGPTESTAQYPVPPSATEPTWAAVPPSVAGPPQNAVRVPGTISAQTVQTPDGAHMAAMTAGVVTDDMVSRLASAAPGAARVFSDGMTNLRKIKELPYSLYLFGAVSPNKYPEPEEEETAPEIKARRRTAPSEFLRLSEAVKMASVLHHIYHGGLGAFPQDVPWYAPYVQYALRHEIILNGEFDDFNEFATRAEVAYIFASAVPTAELPVINTSPKLSDIGEHDAYGDAVNLLHKAGVLATNDRERRFYPESLITRTEAAAIIGRIATPGDRKRY